MPATLAALLSAIILSGGHGSVATNFQCELSPIYGNGNAAYWLPGTIALNSWLCEMISKESRTQSTSSDSAMAIFILAHEMGHAIYGSDEKQADCKGAGLFSTVVYATGLRGHNRFAAILSEAKANGGEYGKVMASCWKPIKPGY